MSAIMDDETLIKAFLKKQKEIQEDFLTRFNQYEVPINTAELKKLVDEYKIAVYGAANITPKLDTSTIDYTIKQAVNKALNTLSLSSLINEVNTQSRAIERNNMLLSNGTGWKLTLWLIVIALILGVMAGWSVNWYFEIPAQVAGNHKLQYQADKANLYLKYINSSCKTKQAFAKWNNQTIEDCNKQYWTLE